jgi:dihydrofolate reductase
MLIKVFIATSVDGFIADEDGAIDWLTESSNCASGDGGYADFITGVDAVLMGRGTFEKVLSFGIEWPYTKKVFVWTSVIKHIDKALDGKVEIVEGDLTYILSQLQIKGVQSLYIDGGKTINTFLANHRVDEIVVTLVPILLGKGIPLFHNTPMSKLQHIKTEVLSGGMVQNHYRVLQ